MIPSSLLHSLQQFFGAKLSQVRLRTGSPLPTLVGAEAIAWDNQIWLADPVPDFSSRETVRLLAHELAHICQQYAAPARPAFPVRIGEGDDRLEAEADACARAFLSGQPCPVLTADPEPVLRRVLSIVPGTAKLTVDFARAKLNADFPVVSGSRLIVCHLTNGFTDINNISDALFWKGETAVRSSVSDPAELRTLRFGFLQFQRIDALNMSYIGRTPSDGEVDINPFGVLTTNPALDSLPAVSPFMNDIDLPVSRGIAEARAGDHPALKAPTQVVNRVTSANNFLFEIIDHRRFWTVLAAQERATGSFRHLAHHSWDLLYRFRLIWHRSNPQVFTNLSSLTQVDQVTAGPPSEPALAGLLASPRPPLANDVSNAALIAAAAGGLPTREDVGRRPNTQVPPNFFT